MANELKQAITSDEHRSRFWDSMWVPLALAVLGTLSLGYAWKIQNYDLASATDTRMTLQRSQLMISIWEAKRDQWVIALRQELTKPNPNQALLPTLLAEANRTTIMWQGYMKVRVEKNPAEHENIFAMRDRLLSTIDELQAKADIKSLMELNAANANVFNASNSLATLDKEYFAIVDETDARVKLATAVTSRFYALGTALMLISTIVSSIQMTRVLGSLQTRLRPALSKKNVKIT